MKPIVPIQWKREAFYLYGAVEPLTGESFFLEFSHWERGRFQAFLQAFSETYADSLNILQVDNNSCPLAKKLMIPANVVLLFQPPYSPDVNPVERVRVWQHLKAKLSWLNLATLDELRRKMDTILNSLTAECLASLTGYDFILAALKKARLIA